MLIFYQVITGIMSTVILIGGVITAILRFTTWGKKARANNKEQYLDNLAHDLQPHCQKICPVACMSDKLVSSLERVVDLDEFSFMSDGDRLKQKCDYHYAQQKIKKSERDYLVKWFARYLKRAKHLQGFEEEIASVTDSYNLVITLTPEQ